VEGLDDFKPPPAIHAPTPTAAWRFVSRWWPMLAALFLLIAILLFVTAARSTRNDLTGDNSPGPTRQQVVDEDFTSVKNQADTLFAQNKVSAARELWISYRDKHPGKDTAAVEAEIATLTNKLSPADSPSILAMRRAKEGNRYSGNERRTIVAMAYLRSAQQLDPALKAAGSGFALQQLERKATATLARRKGAPKEDIIRIISDTTALLEQNIPSAFAAAETRLLDAVEDDPENPGIWIELGRLYRNHGQTDDARVMWTHAQTLSMDGEQRRNLSQYLDAL
jgi:tetratricopeptide (TPR) repeat protein